MKLCFRFYGANQIVRAIDKIDGGHFDHFILQNVELSEVSPLMKRTYHLTNDRTQKKSEWNELGKADMFPLRLTRHEE
jgi:hypothetical protein